MLSCTFDCTPTPVMEPFLSPRDVAMAIVNGSNWEEALRNVTETQKGEKTTPFRKLIQKMPSKTFYISYSLAPLSINLRI